MVVEDRFAASTKAFIRRFYETRKKTLLNSSAYQSYVTYDVTKMDSVVIIPTTSNGNVSVAIDVSVDEPIYRTNGTINDSQDNGETLTGSLSSDVANFQNSFVNAGRFDWHNFYDTKTVTEVTGNDPTNIKDDTFTLSPFSTGITMLRIRAQRATSGETPTLFTRMRGYYIER